MSEPGQLLTVDTVCAYVAASKVAFASGAALTATEICGGNLNFAFQVVDVASSESVFVKQTPGFVKVLGPEAKISNQRLVVEQAAYAEWEKAIGGAAEAASLPKVLHFDSTHMVLIMEFLGSSVLLHERLVCGIADKPVAVTLGKFLGAAHAATHSTLVPQERAADMTSRFANNELRGLQLEYVFSKPFRESDRATVLRDDLPFMHEVDALKAAYRGETPSNLALCHGDFHAGSVMVDPANATAPMKVIDPEFAIYGPPGLDVGCLLSSYVLASIQRSVEGTLNDVRQLRDAVSMIWDAYAVAMAARGVGATVLEAIAADAAGFAGCEIARTALGFAGVRGFSIADEARKTAAEEAALQIACRCVKGRSTGGIALLLNELDGLL